MTEAIYIEVTERTKVARKDRQRVSVSGMLKILGVSRSGYNAWSKHVPSNAEKRLEAEKSKSSLFMMSLCKIRVFQKLQCYYVNQRKTFLNVPFISI